MARLDVYANMAADGYLVDCQSDMLSGLATRFVVPLLPEAGVPRATRLNPVFRIGSEVVVMATQLGGAVPRHDLTSRVASLDDHHDVITNAIDTLLTGF